MAAAAAVMTIFGMEIGPPNHGRRRQRPGTRRWREYRCNGRPAPHRRPEPGRSPARVCPDTKASRRADMGCANAPARRRGKRNQDRDRGSDGKHGNFVGHRINDGEVGRPDHFQKITPDGQRRVFQAIAQRNICQRDDRFPLALRQECDDTGNRREQKERPLLQRQSQNIARLPLRYRSPSGAARSPATT